MAPTNAIAVGPVLLPGIENEVSPCGSRQVEGAANRRGQQLCDRPRADCRARLSHPLKDPTRFGLDFRRRLELIETSLGGIKDHEHVNVADVS
jgi:hypothetical protein